LLWEFTTRRTREKSHQVGNLVEANFAHRLEDWKDGVTDSIAKVSVGKDAAGDQGEVKRRVSVKGQSRRDHLVQQGGRDKASEGVFLGGQDCARVGIE
jgi:hypothetical protein